MKWTSEQLEAIRTTGVDLLVSAAAGSGKTAVLAQRCAYLICDAPERCNVDELLVVTFTKAAAAEMRDRIESALQERLEASEDPRLQKQIRLLERAQISTIHGFCTEILRQNFHRVDLDPNFRVLDEEEINLLKREIARKMLDERYESDQAGEFRKLVDLHGNGNDQIIQRHVIRLYDLLCSVVDPDGWLDSAKARIAEAITTKSLSKSFLGAQLLNNVRDWLDDIKNQWLRLADQTQNLDGLHGYVDFIGEYIAAIHCWQQSLGDGNLDGLAKEIAEFKASRLPQVSNSVPHKEAIQAAINEIRKQMRESSIAGMCRFTEQQWRDGLKSTLGPTELFIDLVRDFAGRFSRVKRELRGVDFADLERLALDILRKNESIVQGYREQFKHVIVDEYQDINEVQDGILSLLSRPASHFSVGDVKQSIYRFRLAQPKRFQERYSQFRKSKSQHSGRVIDLRSNFRSREPLLNVINAVFERLMTESAGEIEYDQSHRLSAGTQYPSDPGISSFSGSPVELHLLPTTREVSEETEADVDLDRTEREAAFIATRIRQLVDSGINATVKSSDGSLKLRPIEYRDIVILLRATKHKSEQFASILRTAGIPVHSDSGAGFFDSTEVRDMCSLLRVLDNPQQDIPLAAVLRSPFFALAECEDSLAQIRLAYPDQDTPFHQAVRNYASEKQDDLAAHLRTVLGELDEWRRMARRRPVAELIWHVYDRTGYLAFCSGMEDSQQRVANLIEFHERARQFGTFQRQGLTRFMQFLQSLEEQIDLAQPSIASQADNVVRVMSIHRSKGLEFPVVFVPDLGRRHNFLDAAGSILIDRDAGIGFMVADEDRRVRYPSLSHALVEDRIRKQTLAEEMRVLYVAMTRAREHLILVGSCPEESEQKWKDEWSRHVGPLPPQRALAGRTLLDWLGPIAAAINGSGAKDGIQITWHGQEEVSKFAVQTERRTSLSEAQMRFVRLEPLNPPPASHAEAQNVIDRLSAEYPHLALTLIAASVSVGSLTKLGPTKESKPLPIDLAIPRFATPQFAIQPTEIGTATHLVLEHLDFSRRCDRNDIELQKSDLVRRKLLAQPLADVVDIDAILWFVETPVGKLLRRNHATIRRELPIYYPIQPPGQATEDPFDRIMVRGRLDVMIPDADGMVIVDYKTDAVTSQTIDARFESYCPQVAAYRTALEQITGKAVKEALLAFLSMREMRSVPRADQRTSRAQLRKTTGL